MADGTPSADTVVVPVPMPDSQPRELSAAELVRYARHLTLPEVGVAGQLRLAGARVLMVGAGGLGSPAARALGPLRLCVRVAMRSLYVSFSVLWPQARLPLA